MEPITPATSETGTPQADVTLIAKAAADTTKRKWIMPIVLTIAFMVVSLSATLGIIIKGPQKKNAIKSTLIVPTPVVYTIKAKAIYSEGNVWKISSGQKKVITEEDVLDEGDQILTETGAKLVLSFDDGSVIRIGENSTISLSQLRPALMRITENTGILYARVNKNEKHKFLIQANQITIESMGTAFAVENKDEINVKVFENTVQVSKGGEPGLNVTEKQQWTESEKDVKNIDDQEIDQNKFLSWSIAEDTKDHPKPTAVNTPSPAIQPTAMPTPTGSRITLTGEAVNTGIKLDWKVAGMDTNLGFKLLKSENANPGYPENTYVYLNTPTVRSYVWDIRDGKTWHFRVCKYVSDKCEVYSNDVSVTAPDGGGTAGQVKSISLTVLKSGVKAVLDWSVDGNSVQGFKVVWSLNAGPVYPSRDGDYYHYYTDPAIRHDEISDLTAGKPYYFRVCEYLGGSCGVYSNEVMVQ